MRPVIAFVPALWRRRFGWDGETVSTTLSVDPEALRAAYREARDAQPDPLVYRSTNRKEQ